jgi:filamentous hemagglutinin family protein
MTNFSKTILAAALMAALSPAFAFPTQTQMPGGGAVTATTGGGWATAVTVNGGAATGTIAGLVNSSTIQLQNAGTVITWGASTGGIPNVADKVNPQGFNLGSSAALTFDGKAAGASVLNIDASGNPSIINGMLSGQGATNNVAVFLANTNGVVVGSTGRLVLPVGGGLIGADMSSATAQQLFIANGTIGAGVQSAAAPLSLAGGITAGGDVLIAGGNVTNTGTISTPATLAITANSYTGAPGFAGNQLTAGAIIASVRGNFNAPISGNTNWLSNAVTAAPFDASKPLHLSISAVGNGRQSINVKVNGSAIIDSGATGATFGPNSMFTIGAGATSAAPSSNGGSQIILNASGNLTAQSNFTFPGGVVLKAGGLLDVGSIYNAWTPVAQAYQGVFLEAPTIVVSGLILTNGTSWVNFSTDPAGGAPSIYQVQTTTAGLNAVFAPGAAHLNTYSSLITGGAVNTTPGIPAISPTLVTSANIGQISGPAGL